MQKNKWLDGRQVAVTMRSGAGCKLRMSMYVKVCRRGAPRSEGERREGKSMTKTPQAFWRGFFIGPQDRTPISLRGVGTVQWAVVQS